MNAELDVKEQRVLTTALLQLSKLLFDCGSKFSIDDLIRFNDLLQKIENTNVQLNRQLTRKIKRYQLIN